MRIRGQIGLVTSLLFMAALGFFIVKDIASPVVRAEQPRSAKEAYRIGALTVYCEDQLSRNKVYVVVNPQAGGAAVWVEKEGCR